jgi:environmental stress-induced protein Ves
MTQHRINALDIVPQAWRNGGGQTRELWVWPPAASARPDDWRLRISLADITQDGPFSAFEGVARWFTVVSGAGVVLTLPGGPLSLRPGDAPLAFDGAIAPACSLLAGPTQDLNLMTRHGQGFMKTIADSARQTCAGGQFGLYCRLAGHVQDGSGQRHALPARGLFWDDDAKAGSDWTFTLQDSANGNTTATTALADPTAASEPAGWWLGFTAEAEC